MNLPKKLSKKLRRIKSPLFKRIKSEVSSRMRIDRLKYENDRGNVDTVKEVKISKEYVEQLADYKIALIKDGDCPPYYTKYERFLQANGISYEIFNIHASDWKVQAARFDIFIWRPLSLPWQLEEAREKIYVLEKYMNKITYPSVKEVQFYENKLLQYDVIDWLGYPVIPTFISHDYDEVNRYIKNEDHFPVVLKIRSGSGSHGVSLIKTASEAEKIVNKIFSNGLPTYWSFIRQKNYVFFQKFVENYGFDLRIIVINRENILGYYRDVPKGEFRVLGYETVATRQLPIEAVRIAVALKEQLGFTTLAVDFLKSKKDDTYHIIECSNFPHTNTPREVIMNDRPGKYEWDEASDALHFIEGEYWIPELALAEFLTTKINKQQYKDDKELVVNHE